MVDNTNKKVSVCIPYYNEVNNVKQMEPKRYCG